MNTARLIIFVIGTLGFLGELSAIKEHEHQYVRLLNHVIAVQAVIRPIRIQRKFRHRDRMNINMRHIKKSVMLFINAAILIYRNPHMLRLAAPVC
ncbi:hypothetical protein D3C75_1015970 [compost metagenome]